MVFLLVMVVCLFFIVDLNSVLNLVWFCVVMNERWMLGILLVFFGVLVVDFEFLVVWKEVVILWKLVGWGFMGGVGGVKVEVGGCWFGVVLKGFDVCCGCCWNCCCCC